MRGNLLLAAAGRLAKAEAEYQLVVYEQRQSSYKGLGTMLTRFARTSWILAVGGCGALQE